MSSHNNPSFSDSDGPESSYDPSLAATASGERRSEQQVPSSLVATAASTSMRMSVKLSQVIPNVAKYFEGSRSLAAQVTKRQATAMCDLFECVFEGADNMWLRCSQCPDVTFVLPMDNQGRIDGDGFVPIFDKILQHAAEEHDEAVPT